MNKTNIMENKTIEQQRKEYLDAKVAYYSEDVNRRATNSAGGCEYLTDDGRKCAIGLDMIETHPSYNNAIGCNNVNDLLEKYPNILPQEVKNLGVSFLFSIQNLHDGASYWNDSGLSISGEYIYNEIIREYCK